jgi:dihydroorotase
MSLVIRGGRIFDPAQGIDRVGDLFIEEGKIAREGTGTEEIRAKGLLVVPGLIDMHVHFREPGREDKETIASGCAAAVAGGFTTVACMANTGHPTDTAVQVMYIRKRAEEIGTANVYPIGAVSKGLKGVELAELGTMAKAGAVAFSDDGFPVMNSELFRRALEYARMFDRVVISHCEDATLTHGSVMNESAVSVELGLRGWPNVAEASMAARDILLAELTGARVHLAHVSTRQTVELLRWAKQKKLPVTAEATPHHLALTDEHLRGYDSRFKMNPPLRSIEDVTAVIGALADGTIDAIASDHAPHTVEEKEQELVACPNGVVGLETSVGIILGLVAEKKLPLGRAIEAMTWAPAGILGVRKGTLLPGADGDVTLIDPKVAWTVETAAFRSRGRSSAFQGMKLRGRAVHTVVGGRICF